MKVASMAMWLAYGPGGRGSWFWPLIPILWIAFFWALVFVFRRRFAWRREHERLGPGSGEAVLAERYARGEISEDDYRQRLAVLRERPR
jgi:putative membrane protein